MNVAKRINYLSGLSVAGIIQCFFCIDMDGLQVAGIANVAKKKPIWVNSCKYYQCFFL